MSGNVLRAPLNGPAKHTGSISGLWWLLLFIFVTILFRQKAQRYTTETPSDGFVHLLESLEFFKCLFPCCRRKTPIIIIITWISPEITQAANGTLKKKAWKASPTLSRQIKDSLYTVLAIKDVHGIFALVLLSGFIDLKPQLLSCDPGLNSLWGGDLSISEGEKEQHTRSVNSG